MSDAETNKSLGYVKLFRSITEWEWFTDPPTAHLFVYLLAKANRKPAKYKGAEIPAGGLITSREALSMATGLTERQIRTALNHLISTNEVTKRSSRKYTLLIVNNWDQYQGSDQQNDQQVTNKRPTGDQQTTSNKNVRSKEVKKKDITFDPMEQIRENYQNPEVLEAWKAFFEMRSGVKGGAVKSAHQTKLLMNALEKNARTDAERIDVINQSIMNGWKGLFPLKEKKNAANCTGYQNGDVSGAYDGYIPWDDYRGNV